MTDALLLIALLLMSLVALVLLAWRNPRTGWETEWDDPGPDPARLLPPCGQPGRACARMVILGCSVDGERLPDRAWCNKCGQAWERL